jgi:DNA-binding FadR family transcriptional regulator
VTGLTASSLALGAYAAVFAPLEAQGRADAVARRLADAITLGLLPDGSYLPSESDLADRFGVATVTVRDALGTLREQNLIRTRRGRGGGSFVQTPDDGGRRALLLRLRRTGLGELRDLADHYAAISAMSAQLAAERADEGDLDRLAALAPTCHEAPSETARRQGEGNFHLELAAAAQSARLAREEMALQSEIGLLLWLSHTATRATAEAAARHTELVDHLARGDGAGARAVAETHVREMFSGVRDLHRVARMEVSG